LGIKPSVFWGLAVDAVRDDLGTLDAIADRMQRADPSAIAFLQSVPIGTLPLSPEEVRRHTAQVMSRRELAMAVARVYEAWQVREAPWGYTNAEVAQTEAVCREAHRFMRIDESALSDLHSRMVAACTAAELEDPENALSSAALASLVDRDSRDAIEALREAIGVDTQRHVQWESALMMIAVGMGVPKGMSEVLKSIRSTLGPDGGAAVGKEADATVATLSGRRWGPTAETRSGRRRMQLSQPWVMP